MLKLFKAYTGQVYKQDAKDHCLTDLQKTWVRSMPEIIKKFNTSKGFNRKFSKPVNVSMNDLVNSCFWVFTHFKSEVERLEAWLNVGTLLFVGTRENQEFGLVPFSKPLDEIEQEMQGRAVEEQSYRKLSFILMMLEEGRVEDAKRYIRKELKSCSGSIKK